jgi:hypothetical protein
MVCFSIGDTIASVGGNVNGSSNGIMIGSLVCASRDGQGTARDEDEIGSFERPPLVLIMRAGRRVRIWILPAVSY